MKLSKLIPHTSECLAIHKPTVTAVAGFLRGAGLISSGGRGPGGAEMTPDDKVNLLLGVCAVETATRAAEHVRIWRRLIRFDNAAGDDRFAFTRAKTIKDFFVGLITEDLNGGALDKWLRETGDEFDRMQGAGAAIRHELTLDFYVDQFEMTLVVARNRVYPHQRTEADTIKIRFVQPVPDAENEFVPRRPGAKLIRRLDADTIRGWGACLLDGLK
jgi:hypothetical protein